MIEMNCVDYLYLGNRVWERRQALGLTQGELAQKTGITASFVGHIERAEKIPSLETVARLSVALDTTMDWLVFGLRHRCEGNSCPLYADLEGLMGEYGLGKGEYKF